MPSAQIADLLQNFRDASSNTSTQGRYFEKFCREWLTLSGEYPEIERVYLWNDWPRRGNIADIGIDLVAETFDGHFYAIQCKFFQEGSEIPKDQIDSFLAASGKTYDGAAFSQLLIMSTAPLGSNAKKTIEGHTPPCCVIRVDQFDDSAFDWEKAIRAFQSDPERSLADAVKPRKEPRPHQVDAIENVKLGFKSADRGKLIMACGTGKTFTSLRIAEEVAPENGLVLYLVPSLMLLAQTLKEWSRESRRTIAPIVVCSDSQAHERDVRAAQALAPKKSRKKSDLEIDDDEPTFDAEELTRPATTKPDVVVQRWRELQALREKSDRERLTVVFSTYQSLQVLIDAQNVGAQIDGELCKLPTFDLVVCDEAHRTTGVTLTKGKDESAFVKVHDDKILSAKKRLYMTATPRVYGDAAQLKAKEKDAVLCSMDDEAIYGAEFHRLGFGDAVEKDLLADYKVLIFAIRDVDAAQQFARYRTMSEVAEKGAVGEEVDKNDVNADDVAKMIGCWRGLSKIGSGLARGSDDFASDPAPMKRAVAFCRSIKESKEFAKAFKIVSDGLVKDAKEESARRSLERIEGAEARERFAASLGETRTPGAKETESTREGVAGGEREDAPLRLELRHVDGGFSGNEREKALEWLRGEEPGTCRILSNVRCLSEGVDVPTLDAALFIAPRNSQVDVIQAVGRVMRKAPGKKFGYVILPIVVSADVAPEVALDDNERYRVVWQTLNALRAHDERFRIMINQLQVGEKPDRIVAIPPTSEPTEEPEAPTDTPPRQQPLAFAQSDFDRGLYAQIVKRCGDRNYLDQWAKEVAELTATRMDFIRKQLEHKTPEQEAAFDELLASLRRESNPRLDEKDALDFLTQHLTTIPVFDALFDENAFSRANPVARKLQAVVDAFHVALSPEERAVEERFKYAVRKQIEGVTTADGRRSVIHKLYEQFFNVALPKTAEKLGVVYTPDEVVDYILQSVDYVMRKEFNRRISNPTAHVLDPFTGTGAFVSRLLTSGLIDRKDLKRKYAEELHANEIMLLAYYIAAANIEETFRGVLRAENVKLQPDESTAFPGIVLTDTFQTTEESNLDPSDDRTLYYETSTNAARRNRQRKTVIEVIIGNPPYSVGQTSGNDNNQNEKYARLDQNIADSYVARSTATLKNSLYDSYIRAFRWASDRIDKRGVIGFVTNGAWIDNKAMEGFRKCLAEEFSTIYVFNLRGNQRTSGELSRKEGGKIFGSGSRAPIAITILVKNPNAKEHKIFYKDIGDYLSREEKLAIIRNFGSVEFTPGWEEIVPNELGDWINQRNGDFSKLFALGDKKDKSIENMTFFAPVYGRGLATSRDAWAYNFSRNELIGNMTRTITFYHQQLDKYVDSGMQVADLDNVRDLVDYDPTQITWTDGLLMQILRSKRFVGNIGDNIRECVYRPFCKEYLFYHKMFNESQTTVPYQFPTINTPNLLICIPGAGSFDFSLLVTDHIPSQHFSNIKGNQCFPLYYYEPYEKYIFKSEDDVVIDGYVQKSAITDAIMLECRSRYGEEVEKEDIFFYVYGALHSPGYRRRYENELKKELARLPLPETPGDFWTCSRVGRELADLHVNYETGVSTIPDRNGAPHKLPEPYAGLSVFLKNADGLPDAELYRVDGKMRLGTRKEQDETGRSIKVFDGTLKYNEHIALSGIPSDAFRYVVNGRSPVEWVVERYYRRLDKPSGIIDDPNLWSDDPKYIFNLIPRLIALSLRTLELVETLPDVG